MFLADRIVASVEIGPPGYTTLGDMALMYTMAKCFGQDAMLWDTEE